MMKKVLTAIYGVAVGVNLFVVISGAFISDWALVSLGLASGALCGYGLWRTMTTFNQSHLFSV